MIYKYGERVRRGRISVKKYVIGATASIMMVGASAFPALAASNDYCGSSSHGCEAAAAAGAQCGSGAASGAFGAFGPGPPGSFYLKKPALIM
jgi:hypothetical protein